MSTRIRIKKFKESNISVDSIFLLTRDQFFKYEDRIPVFEDTWWLSTPGVKDRTVLAVSADRYSSSISEYDVDTILAIRPAIKIYNTDGLELKERFFFGGHNWTVIDKHLAICDGAICYLQFKTKDEQDNVCDYAGSAIHKLLKVWLDEKRNGNDTTRSDEMKQAYGYIVKHGYEEKYLNHQFNFVIFADEVDTADSYIERFIKKEIEENRFTNDLGETMDWWWKHYSVEKVSVSKFDTANIVWIEGE